MTTRMNNRRRMTRRSQGMMRRQHIIPRAFTRRLQRGRIRVKSTRDRNPGHRVALRNTTQDHLSPQQSGQNRRMRSRRRMSRPRISSLSTRVSQSTTSTRRNSNNVNPSHRRLMSYMRRTPRRGQRRRTRRAPNRGITHTLPRQGRRGSQRRSR